MANCWSIGMFFIFFLGFFCLWNCVRREEAQTDEDWYGCTDQLGKPTDFFSIYKLPQEQKSSYPIILREGTAYIYLTPEAETRLQSGGISSILSYSDFSSSWILSNVSINDDFSMPGRTLSRLYKDNKFRTNALFMMYNDEFPNGSVSITHGHTKGILMLSELGGYWIIHSVPKFPPSPKDTYSYPHNARRYGQSMLCISLPPVSHSLAENIGMQLLQNEARVYSWNIPSHMASKYPIFQDVVKGTAFDVSSFYRITRIQSILGKTFTSFAKSRLFNEDLYEHLVAPVLKINLFVETWRNGRYPLPSSCNSTFVVENIESVKASSAGVSFSTHRDHSKWAVSQDPDKPYVCVGDINRMETQYARGGGTVCLWSLSIWYRFKNLIQNLDSCPLQIMQI